MTAERRSGPISRIYTGFEQKVNSMPREEGRVPKHVEVGESSTMPGEKGVHVREEVQAGAYLITIHGDETDLRSPWTIQINANTHLNPVRADGSHEMGRYVNHSCDPNTRLAVMHDEKGKIEFGVFAIKDIEKDGEMTLDYASFEDTPTLEGVPCLCGSENCRGVVMGFNTLPTDIQQRYVDEGIALPYLAEKFRQVDEE